MTIRFCRLMGLASCILLLVLNIYFSFMWIYSDYFFPIELVRVLFSQESHPICRYALEFRSNLAVGLISFMYSMWGIGVSTVFTFPVIITAVKTDFFNECSLNLTFDNGLSFSSSSLGLPYLSSHCSPSLEFKSTIYFN